MFEPGPGVGSQGGSVALLDEPARPDWLPQLTVDQLHGVAPGADLAYLLDFADDDAADDAALVEAVAAWERMASWALAGAARAAALLAGREAMNPEWPESAGRVGEPNVAGEEIAMRLACSRRAARALVRHGRAFAGALAPTGQALARGAIDAAKARVLVDALDRDVVPVELALDVQDAVLPGAPGWTPTELAKQVTRSLLVADPSGAAARHDAARRGRRLDRPRVLPDGMAGVWAVLEAADAVRLDAGIDTLARSARAHGDPRTLDQLRADLLVEMTVGRLDGSDGHGPYDAALLGSDVPTHTRGAGSAVDPPVQAGPERCDGRCGAARPTAPRSQVRVTVPLSSLVGVDDAPGEVAGYGAVMAETARALALGGVWRRVVTDPMSGAVLDVGRTRYRPPAALAEHVRTRDGTCVRPGCSADAGGCDLDHTVDFNRGDGTTSHDNLGPLCVRDHQVKSDGGLRLAQVAPGRFQWVTPTGHRYDVEPGTRRARRHTPPGLDESADEGVPPDRDLPPF